MKTCHEMESDILNNNMNGEILNHLKTCDDCRLYYELCSNEPIDSLIPIEVINQTVTSSIRQAEVKQAKRNQLSLILFMLLSGLLLITVYAITYDTLIIFMKRYLLVVSTVMPISLPVISIIRRKAVFK
ncbi:MAG: hypothetical protein JEZ08_07375 [Clostridiales bacterium]|nr:hypothetical protein [Clostridiales bacterium]